jgi:signal transduction histidine kinase
MSNGRLRVEGASGESASGLLGMISPEGSKGHHVLARKRSERVDSALEDPEMHPEGESLSLEAQALLLVPLIVRGEAIGVITVADKEGRDPRFSDEDLRLAEAFAARAAAAVELTRRVSRDTVRTVLQAQETERARLSRELHDQTGQALAALKLGLGRARRAETLEGARDSLGELDALLGEALADLRTIAVELRPAALDEFGLVPALERLARTIRDSHPVEVQLVATLEEGERLPDEIETALYRIVQEALSNVVKHSEASRVDIAVVRRDQLVIATVEDDGRGFDPLRTSPERLGLTGIRERASIFGGRALIESIPGRGTTITAELPLSI